MTETVKKPAMCVGELIALLNEFPSDLPVATYYMPFDPIEIRLATWKDEFEYLNLL